MTKQTAPETNRAVSSGRSWGWLAMLFVILAFATFMGMFGYGYFQLSRVNIALAHTIAGVSQSSGDTRQAVMELREKVTTLEEKLAATQQATADQKQTDHLDQWQVAEAKYLVTLANDQLRYTHDAAQAITLLQQADEALRSVQTTNVSDIQKAINNDITTLQTSPQVDTAAIYTQLVAVNNQIDQLTLSANPLQSTDSTSDTVAVTPDASWWKAGLERSWQVLHKFIVVRNMNQQGMPLTMPEEKVFLYQNLHASLQQAMWAVLYRHNDVYQASLTNCVNWIKQYFAQETPLAASLLQSLGALQQIDIKPTAINLDATLQLFVPAAAGTASIQSGVSAQQ